MAARIEMIYGIFSAVGFSVVWVFVVMPLLRRWFIGDGD
jgi:hypothetical protein